MALNCGNYLITLLLDLSKTFDTVDHKTLFGKLYRLGVRGLGLEFLMSYLLFRYQYVCFNKVNSSRLIIATGVPRGSILVPLLFLIYLNDMSKPFDKLHFVHFFWMTQLYFWRVANYVVCPSL